MGLYTSLDFNGSLSVYIGLYASLLVNMGPIRSLCIVEGACGSL